MRLTDFCFNTTIAVLAVIAVVWVSVGLFSEKIPTCYYPKTSELTLAKPYNIVAYINWGPDIISYRFDTVKEAQEVIATMKQCVN